MIFHNQVFIILVLLSIFVIKHSGHAYPRNFQSGSYYVVNSPGHEMANLFPTNQFYSEIIPDNRLITMLSNPSSPQLISQNHRYMTKTPERDLHYATILKQQEQATIRHPFQAFQVAKDQANMRGHILRNTLQTSDDDVYEVESAPVMKAASPYQYHSHYNIYRTGHHPTSIVARTPYGYHQHQHLQETQPSMEFPLSLSLDQSPHNYYNQYPHLDQYAPVFEASRRRWPQKRYLIDHQDSTSNNGQESRTKELSTSIRVSGSSPPNQFHHPTNKPTKNLYMTIGIDSQNDYDSYTSQSQQRPRIYDTQQSNNHKQNSSSTNLILAQVVAPADNNQDITSSWLDMGAYSSNKGAFGWYSDTPIIEENNNDSKRNQKK